MNYQKYADKAYTKIKQYGSAITVKRSGKKVYDKTTNTYTDTGRIISGYAIQRNFDQRNIDGTNIKYGDVQFMAVLDDAPMSNDEVSFGSRTYTIISVNAMNPDGSVDLFYSIQAR